MKKNMGTTDRLVRVFLAILMVILYFTGTLSGVLGILLLVFAGVFVLTSLVSFCPIYPIFGFNTCPMKEISSKE